MNLLVGTYSQALPGMDAHGDGIYSVSFDPVSATFGTPKLVASSVNSSALVFNSDSQILFATKEVLAADTPELISFRLQDEYLVPLSKLALSGELPCHIAVEPNTKRIASAQYRTGDVVLCDTEDGAFQGESYCWQNAGSGPNPARQTGPHAHCVVFSDQGSVLHVTDLGADIIVSHRLDKSGHIVETACLQTPPGSGARHIAINREGNRAYVACELSEQLLELHRSGLGWKLQNQLGAFELQGGVEGSVAAIRLSEDERFLYLSGRRQSLIAAFDVERTARRIGEFETGGVCPREFILSKCNEWLFCGNQSSGTVAALRRDSMDGGLSTATALCKIGSPVAIVEVST